MDQYGGNGIARLINLRTSNSIVAVLSERSNVAGKRGCVAEINRLHGIIMLAVLRQL